MPARRRLLIALIALQVAPAALAGERIVTVTAAPAQPNGEPWDALDGPPDIVFCAGPKDSNLCYAGKQSVCPSDTFTCTGGVQVPEGEPFQLYFWDADVLQKDRLGYAMCQADATCTFDGLAALQVEIWRPPAKPYSELAVGVSAARASTPGERGHFGVAAHASLLQATGMSGLVGLGTARALADWRHGYDLRAGFGPATASPTRLLGLVFGVGADRMMANDIGARKALYGFVGGQLVLQQPNVFVLASASYSVRSAPASSEAGRLGAWISTEATTLRIGGEYRVYREDLMRGAPMASYWLLGLGGPLP